MESYLKYFAPMLITLIICTGCTQGGKILELPQSQDEKYCVKAVRYKDGTILLRDNGTYNSTSRKQLPNIEPAAKEIHFGPREINFGS